MKDVKIPNGVNSIGKYAFFNCEALSSVILSASVESIAKFAFGNTALAEIHFPEKIEITSMDTSAFGTNTYNMTVYIFKDSWSDKNQSLWDIGFSSIKYE